MTQIVQGHEIVTLINVFTVAPQDQQALIDVLVEATRKVMNTQPGFLSAIFTRAWMELMSSTMPNGAAGKTLRPC